MGGIQTATLEMSQAVNAIVTKARSLHEGIPDCVIVLGASGVTRSGQNHGHFAPKRWVRRDGDDHYGEILLAGESLERGAVPTLGTILHELSHAYADANDVKDTSNNGRYHNAKFKDIGEKFGISLEKVDTIGWSRTSVPESTQAVYAQEISDLEKAISTYRVPPSQLAELLGKALKPKQKKRKMQCPKCEEPLLTTLKWWELNGHKLKCTEHNISFEMFEEE